ncbi:Kunitz-type protease inhibitor 1 [Labeo rohita]|uniref:Kunitz-type protease inhibitor 1 n=1 Tax=Labeo rohita TaxID=84645 RepID=A0ABQ8LM17_LABRO|nr:Kunitz-type protease inhibitor 1 [Labeo rohita]
MGLWRFLFAALVFILSVHDGESQSSTAESLTSAQHQCVHNFKTGRENFVLDTEESIEDGAVFLANPSVAHRNECIAQCCRDPKCNLALIENGHETGSSNSCFLFNCLYKQKYVCRFIQKRGFTNYILNSVYEHYLNVRKSDGKEKLPIANPGRDVVVQPNEEVFLNGIESWGEKKIVNYQWSLISGDESVQIEKTDLPDQVRVSKLVPGVYKFKLTVTDSLQRSDSAQVTVLVLTPDQSERHCLAPKKVGPCRGYFPRWHYNAASKNCEQFYFGGCKENNNNYLSKQECLNACKNAECSSSCREDEFECSNGCCVKKEFECDEQQQCSDGSDEQNCDQSHCTDPPVVGPCRASFNRWYYDPLHKKCHRFTYGGCDGNENNFETTDKCMNNCSGVTENDVFAEGLFVRGEGELGESQSASVALAVVVVIAILAVLAVLGYCFIKNKRKNHQHQRVATNNPPVVYSEDDQQLVYNSTTAKA